MQVETLGTALFAVALAHTFLASQVSKLAHLFKKKSLLHKFFHLLSEVEIIFGFWAVIFLLTWGVKEGLAPVLQYQSSLSMLEPLLIFCIMLVASSRPVITSARQLILFVSAQLEKKSGASRQMLQLFVVLSVGPLLGSLITEPAAITIAALLIYRMIDEVKIDSSLLYAILALLFVNVSVGGALSHFAAPPILIVARIWNWGLPDVFLQLGLAAVATVLINNLIFLYFFKNKINSMMFPLEKDHYIMPIWLSAVHMGFLAAIVIAAHHAVIMFVLFLCFLLLTGFTKKYQDALKFRQSSLVAIFLGGLIVFGSFQNWWLAPLITNLSEKSLFSGAVALTAVTDNAALTYLGSQVAGLSEAAKWALVAGSLVGGGLTILANAPNPVGFSILSSKFPDSSLNSIKLLKAALLPSLVAFVCFYLRLFILSPF